MVLPDVELTVAARDDTGQALNHVHARLLDINATVERQTAIMQRTEKEYARFADQVQLSGANAMGTFKDMHTMLGKINEALRDNQKAQKEVNKETSKASMGGGADSGSMQYMKKVSDADVTSRAELRKIANRAAITQEEAYQNSLLQKQRDGTQQYLSGLKSANDEKDTESQKNNKRRLGKHQETLDEEYVSQKTFQDKSMQELVAHENLTGDHHAQSGKRELQLHKQATKDSVAEVKEKHDKILQQRKVSDNEQSAIRKQSLDADIAEAKQANEKDEREGTAHTDRLISNRKTHHEKELVNNQEFRSKALALLENEQAKEILMIDESDVIALVHAKESHIAQIAELTDHLNQKDSALEDEFNKETLMHKASGERLLGVDKEILGERLAHIKEQHGIVESEAKVHEAKLLQIRKHSRRTEISKVQYEGDVGTEGISQRLRAESTQRKQLEEEQIRDSKIRAKTLKEISDIELEETLANQKISHNQQLAESKNFTDEKIEDMKRAAAESTAIAKQESVEKSRIQKQSAQEQQSIRDRQNDKRLDQLKKSQADEMESLKAIGDKKLDRRERRNKKEMDTMLDYREREKNETEKLLDEGIMNMKRGIERKEALMEREAQNAVTARNKQADDEIRAMTRQKKKEISIIKSSLEKLEVEYKRDRRIALMNLNAKHEKEIGAIDSHEKVKIALAQESQAKEKQDAISYYDELYGIERSALEEKEALLENKLRVERATKEVGRDKDIASVKAHGERINDEEKANHRQSLSQLESYGRKRLAEIDHMTEMEAEKLRQAQRKMSRKISDSIKGSKFGKALGKVDRGITGFLAADFAMIGVREVFDFVKGLGQALIKMEAMKLSLTAVEGSAEKAYVQLARIVDIAKKPGVHLESAIKTTVTLRALKLEGDLVEKTIVNIGNALATLGREQELGGVTLALSQIIGKGKVHAEEINQIAERLPLIRGVLVEQFGTANTEILQKMDISITDFVAKITEGLGNLPKVATTIGTEFKNMQNQWFLFKTSLGTLIKPGLMTSIRGFTKLLELGNNFLDKLNKGGKEDTIARDKLFRSMGHVEDYMTSVGKNDPLNESLKKLTAKLEQHRVELEKLKEGAPIGLTSSALALDTLIERIKLTEGGYNPNEPKHVGGESYAGITRATYDEWAKGPVIKSMKELAKYPDVVMKFYREYLSNVQELPEFLQYTFADFYTNARGQAVKIIQEMAGATADGIWGTETSAAVGCVEKRDGVGSVKRPNC